jgi:hypothetical protein
MSNKIKVDVCPECGTEYKGSLYCHKHIEEGNRRRYVRTKEIERDKKQVSSLFTIVDWFSTRSGAGLILEDTDGNTYNLYMPDIFSLIDGMTLGKLTIEEVKKGTAYGWKVVNSTVRK